MEENYIWPRITKETSLEEVREIHKKIWDYVIEHGEKPCTTYRYDCVLCEYAVCCLPSERPSFAKCSMCPAIWNSEICENRDSEYREWKISSPEDKKYWAKKIRDIPFQGDFGEA